MTFSNLFVALLVLGTVLFSAPLFGQGEISLGKDTLVVKSAGDPYTLKTDPVSGDKLGPVEKQIIFSHDGREFRFASEKSLAKFKLDPASFIAKVDAAMITEQLPYYPMTTCPVSGADLGDMGEPVNIIYQNRLVRFCCKGCSPKFQKEPAKFIAKLDAAVVEKQGSQYALSTCVVSGEELGGEMGAPVDMVVGNRLIRLCCKSCKKSVKKDPLAALEKLAAAKTFGKSGKTAEAGVKPSGHDDDDDDDNDDDDNDGDHNHEHDHDGDRR